MSKTDPFAAPEPKKATRKAVEEVAPPVSEPSSEPEGTPGPEDETGAPEEGLGGTPAPESTGEASETAEEATTTPTEASETSGYEEYTVAELRAELATRNLTQSGNKADLISRLEEDDARP